MLREVNTYSGVHRRLIICRGQASQYPCECGKIAEQWAYIHDPPCPNERIDDRGLKYTLDVWHYKPMCRRCHRRWDNSHITECPHGHRYTAENTIIDAGKRKCKTCVYARNRGRKPTPAQHERRMHLQRLRRAAAKDRNV